METSKNPNLIKNGGGGTNVGNALRWLAKQGKNISPELLDMAGSITGIKQLSSLGNVIRGDKNLAAPDKELLLQEMENETRYILN